MIESSSRDQRKQSTVPKLNTGDSESDADDENDRMHAHQEVATVKSNSRVKLGGTPPAVLLENGASVSDNPVEAENKTVEEQDKLADSAEVESKHTIRLVAIDKLLRPSLVGASAEKTSPSKPSARKTKKKNDSVIEISDESDDCDGSDEEDNLEQLEGDLSEIKTRFGLTEIRDHQNFVIHSFACNTRQSPVASQKRKIRKTGNMGKTDDQDKKEIENTEIDVSQKDVDDSDDARVVQNDQSEVGKETQNDSDSDEPVLRNRQKASNNIPRQKNNTRNKRKRRAVTDSEEENNAEKTSNFNGNSDDSEKGSDQSDEFTAGNTASSRSQRAAERSKRATNRTQCSESTAEQAETANVNDFQPRKKRTRIRKNSSSSSDDEGSGSKRKRKRGKKSKAEDDSDADSPNKGRKNIRKLMKKSDLEETTKNAAQEERERKQRIIERQKLYNQVYDEKPEEARVLEKLVLDFDDETKEPLLEVDKKLVKLLKPHQANGIKFMFDACFESLDQMKESKGSGCILAHCMGLGKTLQVVTLTHTLLSNSDTTGVERVLIVCPLSTVLNWANEFNMWMKHVKKGTEVEVYEISRYKDNVARANKLMEWHNEGGVMILGYDMFRNLSNPTASRIRKKVRESLQTSLIDPGPELIVCDEGHLLKNEKTSLSQMVNRITTMRRIVLTGTPIQNNMKEYYCMVQFVKPKLLGTYTEYMNRFVNPITNGQYTDSTPYDIQLMRKRAHVLHKLLDGCVQRRDYAVLAPFLPPKLEFVVSIKLTPLQSTLYKHYMENFAGKRLMNDPTQKRSSLLFTDFQNLQRIWTHPRVLRYNSDRYEIQQQRKLLLDSENESVGSMKDFIDDVSEEEADSTPESSGGSEDDDDKSADINSDESSKRKKQTGSTRSTRRNPVEDDDVIVQKPENPTEWWMQMCPETELDNLDHSGKLIVLMEILKECEAIGDKLLVFSQSLYSLDVIEHFLTLLDENMQKDEEDRNEQLSKYPGSWSLGLDYFRLDGSTSIDNRNDACKIFNDESNTRARLFLISTRAGGLGINLVAANRVAIFDVSWNPSHDIQSIFRVYRFGQNKPCYIYRFIAMGTMEEKIYERQVTKQAISKRVIDEQQIDRHYKENDLQELYRYDVDPSEPRPVPNLPKDRLFAELLKRFDTIIYKYHEHDSLLENKEEETLNEEERKAAWEEFEQEKNRPPMPNYGNIGLGMGMGMGVGMGGRVNSPVTSSTIFGFRNDVLLKLLNIKAREDNPTFNDATINAMIPYLMQQLAQQMKDGELTMYQSLCNLYYKLEIPSVNPQYPMSGYAMQGGIAGQIATQGVIGQQLPKGMGVGADISNMIYNVNPNQTGIRPLLPPHVPMQQPGISGMHNFGQVPLSGNASVLPNKGPITVDPEIVELD
ncbi:transcriptional regulator ATRX homolog [Anopheles nili]|uniref:transcriptional regulator ATRX homolog n=1 Tax=Anopheles nili TaxID=185578 RepID=UPI00237B0954|nr:transcriptional regulator ATRX homolog [Anopheles nili]